MYRRKDYCISSAVRWKKKETKPTLNRVDVSLKWARDDSIERGVQGGTRKWILDQWSLEIVLGRATPAKGLKRIPFPSTRVNRTFPSGGQCF